MNTSKKINVNFSSLVGLKAELLRKQTEIKDARAKKDNQPNVPKSKTKTKKRKEKLGKVEPVYTEIEDVATLKKSRVMLEAKSMLYQHLKKTGSNEAPGYLVDFANKSDSSENEFQQEEDYNETNSDPDDDWVEYNDCFGRTRKCLRRDLPMMQEKDNLVKREITKKPPQIETEMEATSRLPIGTVEKEPEIEVMRKKWEKQMETLADKTDIHYQDVLFDEARAHGVGYYAFSQKEEERTKQQENLAKLRQETERRQKESQEMRDLKNKIELNRLRAAMIRKRVRSGLSAELTEDQEEALRACVNSRNSTNMPEEEASPEAIPTEATQVNLQKSPTDNSFIIVEDKIKAFGELLGKRSKWDEMSQEEWVYKRRKDRLGEFAPVYENFRRAHCTNVKRDTEISMRDEDEKDPIRINSTGPEPTDLWESQGQTYQEAIGMKQGSKETVEIPKDESPVQESHGDTKIIEHNNDEDVIGPLPSCSSANFPSATFINSFVPQPIATSPAGPISFDRLASAPTMINFSVPSDSKSVLAVNNKHPKRISEAEDSLESNDPIVTGPVSVPLMNDFSALPVQNCDPTPVDSHVDSLLDIPLPATIQFSPPDNYTVTPKQLPRNATSVKDCEAESSRFLDPDKIVAGLKYLRQKFDDTKNS